MDRVTIIAGNWKMHKTIQETERFLATLAPHLGKSQAAVYLAVPFTAIQAASSYVHKKNLSISIGAQNMHSEAQGAFTGEISAEMLKEVGAQFVILGHSERRHIFHESDVFINAKVKRALEVGLQPILCIGETLAQKQAGKMKAVLKQQLLESLAGITIAQLGKMVIAYEPVWAIGTGKVAHPADAQGAHAYCRELIAAEWSEEVADTLVIQYGGSVKPENTTALLAQQDIDGLLVGGAALDVQSFANIFNTYQGSKS